MEQIFRLIVIITDASVLCYTEEDILIVAIQPGECLRSLLRSQSGEREGAGISSCEQVELSGKNRCVREKGSHDY